MSQDFLAKLMELTGEDDDGGFRLRWFIAEKLEFQVFPNRQKSVFDQVETGGWQVTFHPALRVALIG